MRYVVTPHRRRRQYEMFMEAMRTVLTLPIKQEINRQMELKRKLDELNSYSGKLSRIAKNIQNGLIMLNTLRDTENAMTHILNQCRTMERIIDRSMELTEELATEGITLEYMESKYSALKMLRKNILPKLTSLIPLFRPEKKGYMDELTSTVEDMMKWVYAAETGLLPEIEET